LLDIALPGTLPVLNRECLSLALKAARALKGTIPPFIRFDRKHYFYHDLPIGYQITQKDFPIMTNGILNYFDHKNNRNSL